MNTPDIKNDNKLMMIFLLIFYFIYVNANLAEGSTFGLINRSASDGIITREGNIMSYQWKFETRDNKIIKLGFSWFLQHNWTYMQNVYRNLRHSELSDWNYFIQHDPFKEYLGSIASWLCILARTYNIPIIDVLLSFVQSFPYQDVGDYQRYAVEVFLDGCGDCSDTAVLFAGLLSALNRNAIFVEYTNHLAVGVTLEPDIAYGDYFANCSSRYFYCETTGTSFRPGECPNEFRGVAATLSRLKTL